MPEPALVLEKIRKSYFGVPVLKGVDLRVQPGEIHGLVGENGAGKSTLMNILFGMPVIRDTGGYEGTILLGGVPMDARSPSEAMDRGVGMVHQEFMLLPGFTVTENVKLNRERTRANLASAALRPLLGGRARALESLDQPAMRRDTRRALDRIGMSLDETALVEGLPVGHMQFVEIAREMDRENARLIVFDEPTAVLTEGEAEELLSAMKSLAAQAIGILFITHRLDEVMAVADRITVLRDGEVVACLPRAEATVARLAELMIGRPLAKRTLPIRKIALDAADILLSVEDLHVAMPGEGVRGVSLQVRRGEILGVAGLAGQGKIGIANGVMGLFPAEGRVLLRGREIPLMNPRAALADRLAFVSEDRRGVGLLLNLSIERNIAATAAQVQGRFLRGARLGLEVAARLRARPGIGERLRRAVEALALFDLKTARSHAREMIRTLDIRCRGPEQVLRSLSGGNQQKVCLARAFTLEPEVLFVSEPTRGIDVGAKERVLDLLVQANRERGTAIVLTSSELAELRQVCDRIVVIDAGRVAGVLPPDAPDVEFGLLMGGKGRG